MEENGLAGRDLPVGLEQKEGVRMKDFGCKILKAEKLVVDPCARTLPLPMFACCS